MIAYVGEKRRHIELPEGWAQIISGRPKEGDRFLNAILYSQTGHVQWLNVELQDLEVSDGLFEYDCLIRRS